MKSIRKITKYRIKDLKEVYRIERKYWSTGDVDVLPAISNASKKIDPMNTNIANDLAKITYFRGGTFQTLVDALKLFGYEPEEEETANE